MKISTFFKKIISTSLDTCPCINIGENQGLETCKNFLLSYPGQDAYISIIKSIINNLNILGRQSQKTLKDWFQKILKLHTQSTKIILIILNDYTDKNDFNSLNKLLFLLPTRTLKSKPCELLKSKIKAICTQDLDSALAVSTALKILNEESPFLENINPLEIKDYTAFIKHLRICEYPDNIINTVAFYGSILGSLSDTAPMAHQARYLLENPVYIKQNLANILEHCTKNVEARKKCLENLQASNRKTIYKEALDAILQTAVQEGNTELAATVFYVTPIVPNLPSNAPSGVIKAHAALKIILTMDGSKRAFREWLHALVLGKVIQSSYQKHGIKLSSTAHVIKIEDFTLNPLAQIQSPEKMPQIFSMLQEIQTNPQLMLDAFQEVSDEFAATSNKKSHELIDQLHKAAQQIRMSAIFTPSNVLSDNPIDQANFVLAIPTEPIPDNIETIKLFREILMTWSEMCQAQGAELVCFSGPIQKETAAEALLNQRAFFENGTDSISTVHGIFTNLVELLGMLKILNKSDSIQVSFKELTETLLHYKTAAGELLWDIHMDKVFVDGMALQEYSFFKSPYSVNGLIIEKESSFQALSDCFLWSHALSFTLQQQKLRGINCFELAYRLLKAQNRFGTLRLYSVPPTETHSEPRLETYMQNFPETRGIFKVAFHPPKHSYDDE